MSVMLASIGEKLDGHTCFHVLMARNIIQKPGVTLGVQLRCVPISLAVFIHEPHLHFATPRSCDACPFGRPGALLLRLCPCCAAII
jgi:hypothetical protein